MKEENTTPAAQEDDNILSSPEHQEENVSTLEKEIRARHEAKIKQSQSDENNNPIQPKINNLKKRKRGKATGFLAILAVALIFLSWGGDWIYRNFIWQPAEEKKQATASTTNSTDYRKRNDLGQNNDTGEKRENRQPEPANTAPGLPPPAPEVGLNKAQFMMRSTSTQTAQGQLKTRREEMIAPAHYNAPQTAERGAIAHDMATLDQATEKSVTPVIRIPYDPDLYIPENTAIPCSMDYRFVSDKTGKLRCTIAKDIWSASGNTKLIEKGTTAFGVYQSGELRHGEGRAFIMITKLRTRQAPYLDIPMVNTNAAGELGESGVEGWIDSHFWKRFGGALMVGMIPDIGAWASNSAGKKDRNTDYTENSRQALAEMAKTTLENSINIPPTLYKNQGEMINLVTGQDIDFSKVYTLRMRHD